ncbi:hypothetical protein [Bradyrhizobium sp.]|nr:hypothetical protein [Bradyrhizobium sp.]
MFREDDAIVVRCLPDWPSRRLRHAAAQAATDASSLGDERGGAGER